jgi:hypothetical protein
MDLKTDRVEGCELVSFVTEQIQLAGSCEKQQ